VSAGALALNGITRRFGEHTAVDNISLEIAAGELLALIGASGSGKTTTLRIVAGYENPDSGRVMLDGRDITNLPPQKRGFGMVFQHYALFPHMSVEDNVAFGLEARGVAKATRVERAHTALDSVGLGSAGKRGIQSLSGGEQQRVALARALVIEPQILLLDEPLSNLDPTLRQATRDELRAMLHRVGVSALFVTHDQEDAFAIADRIAVIRRGKLLQVGAPEELYDRPASLGVASFIGRATILPAEPAGDRMALTIGGVRREFAVTRPPSASTRAASVSSSGIDCSAPSETRKKYGVVSQTLTITTAIRGQVTNESHEKTGPPNSQGTCVCRIELLTTPKSSLRRPPHTRSERKPGIAYGITRIER